MKQKLFAFTVIASLASQPVLANDTSITFVAGVPRIQSEKQIAMLAEDLHFRYVQPQPVLARDQAHCPSESFFEQGVCYQEAYWQAEHVYTFQNKGPAKNLTIALPFDLPEAPAESDHRGPLLDDREGNRDLQTGVDGQHLKVTQTNVKIQDPVPMNRLYWVQVHFAAGQTRRLSHRYRSYAVTSVGGMRYSYLLRTGSNWSGPIGKVQISFELPPGHGPCVVANLPYAYDGHELKVNLINWTPDRDFEVIFADRQRALINAGIYAGGQTLAEVCTDALALPPAERLELADQIEYLYGKPHSQRSLALEKGALPMCLSADYFNVLSPEQEAYQPEWGIHAIDFLPDPEYPNTMPPLLRACVQALRQD